MKKIALIVFGIVLLGGIGFALWWVNEREREVDIPKESFIPYNSAVVINVNANANLSPKIATAFDREIKAFRKSMLSRVVDTLKQVSQVDTSSYVDGDSGGRETIDSFFVRVEPEWFVFQGGCTCFFAKDVCRGAGERAKI